MQTIDGCRITIAELANALHETGIYLRDTFDRADLIDPCIDDEDSPGYTDVRLQVHNGSWYYHTGDSSYDQDHRGFWGASSISRGCSWSEARYVARDLIEQAAEDFACTLGCELSIKRQRGA